MYVPDRDLLFNLQAYRLGMFGPKYQWIILGGYNDDWWTVEDTTLPCTVAELNMTLHGYLATDILPLSSSRKRTESGLVSEYIIFNKELRCMGKLLFAFFTKGNNFVISVCFPGRQSLFQNEVYP